ncbi:MAG TPA: DEAD/DEAH box helicase [Tepidisphaeraceae bacterium]|jgi:ATP-dependent Lhr-like helicase|nr:DEAD/DEAH box helicase [Tepidisphaeraceae bacterium]
MPVAIEGFHPTIQRWFARKFGEPTEPQREGWPQIRAGNHTLISAPTGMGKTLAAYLAAIDSLARQGAALRDQTYVLYVSPLRALSNDVQKNLQIPLRELTELDPDLPKIRVLVRTGDTPQHQRASMLRKPPHILVTTPESLYILLTSAGGREMLRTVKTVIVDEIHAIARDKRGSHLALSLERLEALTGPFQRIGLSATQKPLDEVGRFLVGVGRDCMLVDVGHRREMDVAIVVPPSPLTTVCSHEQWDEIYGQIAQLINEHRTTLIFVNTRKLAERITARLTGVLGEDKVTCHHSSLSRERRLDAEHRLKSGSLRALVATASLELGIDIGDVDLAIQVGATRSIATFLQRVGRSGHAVRRMPKGRLFPLTIDELVEAAALLRAAQRGELDRTPQPSAPLDILAQQIVAACVEAGEQGWNEQTLFESFKRAWPYRQLTREDFDAVIKMHIDGRHGLLHRDGVGGRIMARKRARLTAITGGGAIPDVADYRVLQDPQGMFVGTLNEDFAVESNVGDIFQLGNTSWRILKVERGVVRVADAQGQPPSIPFWLGEGPSRTPELSAGIAALREDCADPLVLQNEIGLSPDAALQISDYITAGRSALGTVPTQKRVVLERFFDESGGMQMVLHAPFGGKINRAWGLALRKRFCRGFGFELQAAANEEAIVISLGLQHSFPLEDVFNYLHPDRVKEILTQAVLDQPMFESRWRWNATRALVLSRFQNGRAVPPQILRMRAGDLLAQAFPAAVACPENLPAGDLPIPMDHPLVRQTIDDCLTEATDIAGLIEVLKGLRDGSIERVAVDTPEPSAFARGILNSQLYTFLDDAPLEERRTQAVLSRRSLDSRLSDSIGALDPLAVDRVRQEVWPQPETVEEVHDALLWMGFATDAEAADWMQWLTPLAAQNRVVHRDERWFALDGPVEPKKILFGRLEALGPVFEDDPRIAIGGQQQALLLELEHEGAIMRTRLDGRTAWCERRLLARIHRYTIDKLRQEIEPVSAGGFLQFLACWQHVDEEYRLDGPRGVSEVLRQLSGFELPAWAWESNVLPRRVRDYKREWLEDVTLMGEFAWGRLWGGATTPIRVTPISFVPRDDLDSWLSMTEPPPSEGLCGPANDLLNPLRAYGAMFPQTLRKAADLVPAHVEMGLADLVSHGLVTCDSFAALRQMITPPSRRRAPLRPVGRWSCFRRMMPPIHSDELNELAARQLLRRTGVVFRRILMREKIPVNWLALTRVYRRMELRGEIRGGRFVAGFSGEQFALPEAVELLRRLRRQEPRDAISVVSADPLNFQGILTPEKRIAPTTRQEVLVG